MLKDVSALFVNNLPMYNEWVFMNNLDGASIVECKDLRSHGMYFKKKIFLKDSTNEHAFTHEALHFSSDNLLTGKNGLKNISKGLNEAITEWLALRSLGHQGGSDWTYMTIYAYILDQIISNGYYSRYYFIDNPEPKKGERMVDDATMKSLAGAFNGVLMAEKEDLNYSSVNSLFDVQNHLLDLLPRKKVNEVKNLFITQENIERIFSKLVCKKGKLIPVDRGKKYDGIIRKHFDPKCVKDFSTRLQQLVN